MTKIQWTLVAMAVVCTGNVWGQRTTGDTIYANESKNVALFFPSPIRQAVTGHKGFVFSYDRDEAGFVGLVQGVDGPDSNLLVITMDGNIFSYNLAYAKELHGFNHFVDKGDAIGRVGVRLKNQASFDSIKTDFQDYKAIGKFLLERKSKKMATTRSQRIQFQLEDMVYLGKEVFLVLEIRNRSEIDFEVGCLEVLKVNGTKNRRASYQEIPMAPTKGPGVPQIIERGNAVRFVCVFPKFTLGENERLKLVLCELNGSRKVELVN